MKTVQELWAKGLAVMPMEVRGAKVDSFSYTSKKTGAKVDVSLIRLSLEVEVNGAFEAAEGSIGGVGSEDVRDIPAWAVRGARLMVGCSEVKREMRRLSVRIVDVCPVPDKKM